jgi:hypothetical protein
MDLWPCWTGMSEWSPAYRSEDEGMHPITASFASELSRPSPRFGTASCVVWTLCGNVHALNPNHNLWGLIE